MKPMWKTIKVIGVKPIENGTLLQISTEAPKEDILKYVSKQGIRGEIKFDDARMISAEQRRKIFACIKDISLYTGYEAEYMRSLLTLAFCYESNIEPFSLSNCSLEVARQYISYLIEFCIDNGIPLSEAAAERTDDIGAYLYVTIKKEICCCCGEKGTVYNLDEAGNQMCLCLQHYDIAKLRGLEQFGRLYKVYGIKVKER